MQGIPTHVRGQIEEAICRPRGTVAFEYTSDQLLDADSEGGILFEVIARSHIFRLERDESFQLNFYHSSPGTGTRVATIPLHHVRPAPKAFLAFTWEPADITLSIGPRVEGGQLHEAKGRIADKQLRVGSDGSVFEFGDKGVSVVGVRVYAGGKPVVLPTALEAWEEVLQSARALHDVVEPDDYLQEVAICNSILTMLVTGFENYGKRRFVELEQEGVAPNVRDLFDVILSNFQLGKGLPDMLAAEAEEKGISTVEHAVHDRRINFQSYQESKKAFKAAYGIRFGDLAVTSQKLERLQQLIDYRHSIVHVSPLLSFLNQERVPPEEPEFSNAELAHEAIELFSYFLKALHEATLELDRMD